MRKLESATTENPIQKMKTDESTNANKFRFLDSNRI